MYRKRQIKITDINEFGVVFGVVPLISPDMPAKQIKAELQLAYNKLDKAMADWKLNVKDSLAESKSLGH
jgi:hypothetical protein